jgi:hypothetical protein
MNIESFLQPSEALSLDKRKKIPLLDRGNYYRGLLVLVRRDRIVDPGERELMIQFGQALDFDRRFCEAAIDDLLKNKYIRDEPMTFSDIGTAETFLRDAVLMARVDGEIHPKELVWLQAIADANGPDDEWVNEKEQPDQSSAKNAGGIVGKAKRTEVAK